MAPTAATPAPTPIPAFAPVDSPVEAGADGEVSEGGGEDVAVADVTVTLGAGVGCEEAAGDDVVTPLDPEDHIDRSEEAK